MILREKKMTKDENYRKSKEARLPIVDFSDEAKKLYRECRELGSITQTHLQDIAHRVTGRFQIPMIQIVFDGVQPSSNDGRRMTLKTQGVFRRSFCGSNIQIYRLTAARRQQRSAKGAISTLLHELVHYLDIEIIGLDKSIHTGGFKWRIGQLTEMLS